MKRPTISSIKLVGAVMKLVVTPDLNKESEDGKLQLFQIEFEDKGDKKKKKTPWMLILSALLVILLLLCILLGMAIYKKSQTRQYKTKRLVTPSYTLSYCEDTSDRKRYERQLDEVNRILQTKVDDLLYQGRIAADLNCVQDHSKMIFKEGKFLDCYSLIKRQGMLSKIPSSDRKKVTACLKAICRQRTSNGSTACTQ